MPVGLGNESPFYIIGRKRRIFYLRTYDDILALEYKTHKDLYDNTVVQRNNTISKFTPMITLLTAEMTATIWLMFKYTKFLHSHDFVWWFLLIIGVLCATIFLEARAVWYFVKCFYGFDFSYIHPADMKIFVDDNKKIIDEHGSETIYNNMIEGISNTYAQVAIENVESINKHTAYMLPSFKAIIATLVLLFINLLIVLSLF